MENDSIKSKIETMNSDNKQLLGEIANIHKSSQKFFKICKISATTLTCLTEDILDMAKMEAGIFSLNHANFILETLIEEIDYIFRFQCEQKGLHFKIDTKDWILKLQVYSDFSRIKQILINLISNAYKFTSIGGITLRIELREELLHLSVIDTGIGLSNSEMTQLFKMFGMINRHRSKLNMKGTGLGLTISLKLAKMLKGDISVKSEENIGSEFTLSLPYISELKDHEEIPEEFNTLPQIIPNTYRTVRSTPC